MFGPERQRPCPMCTNLLDAWEGNAADIGQRISPRAGPARRPGPGPAVDGAGLHAGGAGSELVPEARLRRLTAAADAVTGRRGRPIAAGRRGLECPAHRRHGRLQRRLNRVWAPS
jgi:hypothetical protein